MKINFHWSPGLDFAPKQKLENNIKETICSGHFQRECKAGDVDVYLKETDPLDNSISGYIVCKDNNQINFTSSPDGSRSEFDLERNIGVAS